MTAQASSRTPAVLALLFNALVWGCSWWPFRFLTERGLHTLWSTALTFLLGAILILLWRPRTLMVVLQVPALWAIALAAGFTNTGFNWAVSIGPVVRIVLLFYLMPVWAALFARLLLHERITGGAMLRIGVALSGAVVVLWQPEIGLPLPDTLADWLALGGGAGFAMVNVMLRRHAALPSEARALAMFLGCAVIAGVPAVVQSVLSGGAMGQIPPSAVHLATWPTAPWGAWLPVLSIFALAFLASNLTLQYGAARLPANLTSVVMLSEVVFATLSAVWLGDETLTMRTLIGGAMILGTALVAATGPAKFDANGTGSGDPGPVDHGASHPPAAASMAQNS